MPTAPTAAPPVQNSQQSSTPSASRRSDQNVAQQAPAGGIRGSGRGRGRGRGRGYWGRVRGGLSRDWIPTMETHSTQESQTVRSNVRPEADATDGSILPSLRPDAPTFVPGQIYTAPDRPKSIRGKSARGDTKAQTRPRNTSVVKSQAPDLATRTHEDILNFVYECPICTAEVTPTAKIWSCRTCWTCFHLTCARKWATNEGSTHIRHRNAEGEFEQTRQWRCPGCNLPKDDLPSTYVCWCEKEIDPRSVPGMPPHSCGQSCGKERKLPKTCPHPCENVCHAGPCPSCTRMGPTQVCFCGRRSITRKCLDTDYDAGWSCGEVCGKDMACGDHHCQRPCHDGPCGTCTETVNGRCYCGKVQKDMLCSVREQEKLSHDPDGRSSWMGIFVCHESCGRAFDCGKHFCEKTCHPQVAQEARCPRSPDLIHNCPCEKTSLADMGIERQTCEDPVPHCNKMCSNTLICGHQCQMVCHNGTCNPCQARVEVLCRCGRTRSQRVCYEVVDDPPQCSRQCRAILNCGRHECGEQCCTGERKATERQASKRKMKSLAAAARLVEAGIEPEHICTRLCGRMLKCGNHTCPQLCHKGHCDSCREAIFDELSCACGRTVLQPPLPCGTSSPICKFECSRPTLCGHPRISHTCHGDDESCPKCPFLGLKPCVCGKKVLKNQPCFLQEPRCGEVCGKLLRCGDHRCRKQCHGTGQCEDAISKCRQTCGKSKGMCGHVCEDVCHASSACKEDKPCQSKMLITCECQRRKQEVKCNSTESSEGNTKKGLACDEECARLARNHRLAEALNIDPTTHTDNFVPYSNDTLKMYKENVSWAQIQEKEMRMFAADEIERQKRFRPMPSYQRAFLHNLAEDFGFDSESMDPEPHRHIQLFKTPKFVKAPMKTLAECLRIRNSQPNDSTQSTEPSLPTRAQTEPFNGFVLLHPRFALTADELQNELQEAFDTTPGLRYEIDFLPDDQITVHALPKSPSTAIPPSSIEASLKALQTRIATIITSQNLATALHLCSLSAFNHITRREKDTSASSNDGWSHVAAKGAMPRTAPRLEALGGKGKYTVLGTKLSAKKRKEEMRKLEVPLVGDWADEVGGEKEEERMEGSEENGEPAGKRGEGGLVVRERGDVSDMLQG